MSATNSPIKLEEEVQDDAGYQINTAAPIVEKVSEKAEALK